mmetsp:Transcript_94713/g.182663  ORF Transcript_94713/g.182663 Transcript_94713/m.182663 type:complete len:220 (-) Transcript_94713:59-718(-)
MCRSTPCVRTSQKRTPNVVFRNHLLCRSTPASPLDRGGSRDGNGDEHCNNMSCLGSSDVCLGSSNCSMMLRMCLQLVRIRWIFALIGTRSCARASPLSRVTPSTNSFFEIELSPSSRRAKSVWASEASMPNSPSQTRTLGCSSNSSSSSMLSVPSPEVSAASKRSPRFCLSTWVFFALMLCMISVSRAACCSVSLKKSAAIILISPKITKVTYTTKKIE